MTPRQASPTRPRPSKTQSRISSPFSEFTKLPQYGEQTYPKLGTFPGAQLWHLSGALSLSNQQICRPQPGQGSDQAPKQQGLHFPILIHIHDVHPYGERKIETRLRKTALTAAQVACMANIGFSATLLARLVNPAARAIIACPLRIGPGSRPISQLIPYVKPTNMTSPIKPSKIDWTKMITKPASPQALVGPKSVAQAAKPSPAITKTPIAKGR
jgi:hypothetical protein